MVFRVHGNMGQATDPTQHRELGIIQNRGPAWQESGRDAACPGTDSEDWSGQRAGQHSCGKTTSKFCADVICLLMGDELRLWV